MKMEIWALILLSAMLASCVPVATPPPAPMPTATLIPTPVPPTATPLPEGIVVISNTPGGLVGGRLYGHGETAVILASRGGYSREEWSSFAQRLADEGFTALTIGSQDSEGITILYVQYAIEFLRKNGFRHILCVGISNGASGCAYNASQPEILGVVLITYHGTADLSHNTLPKLFLGAELEKIYRPLSEKAYETASEPKQIVIVAGSSETGPALLDIPGQNLREVVVDFLKACADK